MSPTSSASQAILYSVSHLEASLLCSIPLYKNSIIYIFIIYLSNIDEHLNCFEFRAIMESPDKNILFLIFGTCMCKLPLVIQ